MARASDSGSGDPGSILGRVGVFVSLSKRHLLPKIVLVIPRNRWLRLNMTEKLFTGTLNHNQNKKESRAGSRKLIIINIRLIFSCQRLEAEEAAKLVRALIYCGSGCVVRTCIIFWCHVTDASGMPV